jgi:catechol 2,3-dioxygenase-like lactoylglutathione lyase family enzyme
MPIELNHTIVAARDPQASAQFLAGILGLHVDPPLAHFTPITLANQVTLDYDQSLDAIQSCHYAFLATDEEFDAAFARIQDAGILRRPRLPEGRPDLSPRQRRLPGCLLPRPRRPPHGDPHPARPVEFRRPSQPSTTTPSPRTKPPCRVVRLLYHPTHRGPRGAGRRARCDLADGLILYKSLEITQYRLFVIIYLVRRMPFRNLLPVIHPFVEGVLLKEPNPHGTCAAWSRCKRRMRRRLYQCLATDVRVRHG